MITVRVKRTGTKRKAWRVKITFGNNEPFPHDYDEKDSAVESVVKIFNNDEPVQLVVVDEDGQPGDPVRLR